MRTFRITEEPGVTRFSRDPDLKAILLLACVEVSLALAYRMVPFPFRAGFLLVFTAIAVGVLWPRLMGEELVLSHRSFKYRRGFWPFLVATELEWRDLDTPRILNAGLRGWRGPIGFNDARTGHPYRVAAGLRPADCRRMLAAIEQFRRSAT
jgi:hypothetical protein